MVDVVIEVDREDSDAISQISEFIGDDSDFYEVSGFGGTEGVVAFIVTISSVTIGSISKILIESVRAKRHVKIKYKGVEISGVSEANLTGILEKISSDEFQ